MDHFFPVVSLGYKKRVTVDAAIIGGGPAGTAAALALRQLMPTGTIAIFYRDSGSIWRGGEVLAPGARAILEPLGCWPAFLECGFLESFGTRAAWGSAECHENEFLFSLRGNGWRLERKQFDAMLLRCALERGVTVHHNGALLDSAAVGSGWKLAFRNFE